LIRQLNKCTFSRGPAGRFFGRSALPPFLLPARKPGNGRYADPSPGKSTLKIA
jgi:hypothetical protein